MCSEERAPDHQAGAGNPIDVADAVVLPVAEEVLRRIAIAREEARQQRVAIEQGDGEAREADGRRAATSRRGPAAAARRCRRRRAREGRRASARKGRLRSPSPGSGARPPRRVASSRAAIRSGREAQVAAASAAAGHPGTPTATIRRAAIARVVVDDDDLALRRPANGPPAMPGSDAGGRGRCS